MNISLDNQLTGMVIGAAIHVHGQLGPGVDELAYEEALSRHLSTLGVAHRRQVPLPLRYKGMQLDCGYRLDLVVEERLPLELKAVSKLLGIHDAQLLTYLRIGKFPLGLLINFNVALLREGIHRLAETRVWRPPPKARNESPEPAKFDPISAVVVKAAIEVHRQLGPGLLANTYEACLCQELTTHKLPFARRHMIPLRLDGEPLSASAEIPLLVADVLPVFSLCVDSLTPVHTAMALSRLRQGSWEQGLLLNYHAPTMIQGIRRIAL